MSLLNFDLPNDMRRKTIRAWFYHDVAQYSLSRCRAIGADWSSENRRLEWYQCYVSFWTTLRGSLYALRNHDGRKYQALEKISTDYFHSDIESSNAFRVIKKERNAVGKAGINKIGSNQDGEPEYIPGSFILMMVRRISRGFSVADSTAEIPPWPEEPYKGKHVFEVMEICRAHLETWLREIDKRFLEAENSAEYSRSPQEPSSRRKGESIE